MGNGIAAGLFLLGLIVIFILILIFSTIRICSEWQRKVVLRLGRFAGVRGPGIFFLLPFIEQTPFTIDMRTVTNSYTAEQTLTRDNVPVNVDIVVFWQVVEPASAVLRVENYAAAVGGAAQTALRDSIGRNDLSQVLSDRAGLDAAMTHALDAQTEPWGIKVQSVQIRDIQIPAVLQDAMSRVAQAERERQARLVLGESEVQVAERFAHAGDLYHDNPMALHLRGMNMLYEVMKAGGTNVVIVPSGAVESMSFGNISGVTALAQEAANLPPTPPPGAPQG
jgi:regulator of protease activity HflC (stomatin/prohibitin superfamily)